MLFPCNFIEKNSLNPSSKDKEYHHNRVNRLNKLLLKYYGKEHDTVFELTVRFYRTNITKDNIATDHTTISPKK